MSPSVALISQLAVLSLANRPKVLTYCHYYLHHSTLANAIILLHSCNNCNTVNIIALYYACVLHVVHYTDYINIQLANCSCFIGYCCGTPKKRGYCESKVYAVNSFISLRKHCEVFLNDFILHMMFLFKP